MPDSLRTCPNVHFLGLLPHEELPSYAAQFDVCLNLFRRSRLSKDVSPLKFYEYLATGKPIVSTLQPEQVQEFEGPVYISRSASGFEEKCAEALAESDPSLREQRIEWGKESSWDGRVRVLRASLWKTASSLMITGRRQLLRRRISEQHPHETTRPQNTPSAFIVVFSGGDILCPVGTFRPATPRPAGLNSADLGVRG